MCVVDWISLSFETARVPFGKRKMCFLTRVVAETVENHHSDANDWNHNFNTGNVDSRPPMRQLFQATGRSVPSKLQPLITQPQQCSEWYSRNAGLPVANDRLTSWISCLHPGKQVHLPPTISRTYLFSRYFSEGGGRRFSIWLFFGLVCRPAVFHLSWWIVRKLAHRRRFRHDRGSTMIWDGLVSCTY